MSEPFSIRKENREGQLLIVLNGRLDAYWSTILSEEIDACIHEGFYSIALDSTGVTYISSAGIRVFVHHYKKLKEIQGSFMLASSSPQVKSVLDMAGLNMLLHGKEHRKKQEPSVQVQESCLGQVRYTVQQMGPEGELTGITIGSAGDLASSRIIPESVHTLPFHSGLYGVGIGAFGDDFGDYCHRMGEFIGLGDVIACLPTDGRKKPDYLSRVGRMIPQVNLLYGMLFEGEYSHRVHFEMMDLKDKLHFTDLIAQLYELVPFKRAGIVMVAETRGLVGVSLATDPLSGDPSAPLFSFPEIKQQVTVTTEPEFNGKLTLTTGIATRIREDTDNGFVRPLKTSSPFWGHFHTAVFSYHPLKKQWDKPQEVIQQLFGEHQFETILHLVNDERPHAGIGESEFLAGTLWIGEIKNMKTG
ncbi:MAG: STAS domain-containing protein [Bacteroidales bacterium]|nr:STAS domain-containing protein [Lentimicrobiaceae bacterium]MDD5695158.1 STAS domain-containing protein [Bacteroidales bacterium]